MGMVTEIQEAVANGTLHDLVIAVTLAQNNFLQSGPGTLLLRAMSIYHKPLG